MNSVSISSVNAEAIVVHNRDWRAKRNRVPPGGATPREYFSMRDHLFIWVRLPWSDVSSRPGDYAIGVTRLVNPLLFVGEVESPVLVEVIVGTHGP